MRNATLVASLLGSTLFIGPLAHAQAARHYDCTKPGNANKTVCKNAAAAPAATPATSTTPVAKTERHYDCTKAGNANKAACKGTAPVAAPAASAAATPAKKPSLLDRLRGHPSAAPPTPANSNEPAAPAPAASAYKGKSITADAAGATGQCKDGSYTHATHHSGACSHHGGVAKWM